MRCSECNYESARFEPFNTLTIPLPEDDFRVANIEFVPKDSNKQPLRCKLKMSKDANMNELLLKLVDFLLQEGEIEYPFEEFKARFDKLANKQRQKIEDQRAKKQRSGSERKMMDRGSDDSDSDDSDGDDIEHRLKVSPTRSEATTFFYFFIFASLLTAPLATIANDVITATQLLEGGY